MSGSNCCFLTYIRISQEADQVVWYSHFMKNFPVCCDPHKGFSVVNEAHVDVVLEFPCFSCGPADVGNLISVSSALSKSSLNIWMFLVLVLLKPGLENFEHYLLVGVWDECKSVVVWTFFGIAFLGIRMKTDLFQSCGHCWVFQICWHIECSTITNHLLGFDIAQLEFHHLHYLCL